MSIDRSQSGNEESIDRFFFNFMQHQDKIYSFVTMLVHNHHDADDIMQEIAIVLWKKFPTYDQDKSFLAWGIGIARNVIHRYREQQHRQEAIFDACVYKTLDHYAEICLNVYNERSVALNHCISKLQEQDQEIVALRYDERLSVKTVAQQLNRSFKGLYQSLTRIHNVLADCISNQLAVRKATS